MGLLSESFDRARRWNVPEPKKGSNSCGSGAVLAATMRVFAIAALVAVAAMGQAQIGEVLRAVENATGPTRVPIRSADPWLIKMMLEGTPVTQPEYSTIWGSASQGGGGFGGSGGGFGGGNQG